MHFLLASTAHLSGGVSCFRKDFLPGDKRRRSQTSYLSIRKKSQWDSFSALWDPAAILMGKEASSLKLLKCKVPFQIHIVKMVSSEVLENANAFCPLTCWNISRKQHSWRQLCRKNSPGKCLLPPLPSPAFQPLPSVYNSILRDYILTFLLHRRGLLGSFTFQGNFWGQAKLPPLLLLPTIHCLLLCSVLWRFILQISVHASLLKQPAFLLPPKKKFCLPSGSQS